MSPSALTPRAATPDDFAVICRLTQSPDHSPSLADEDEAGRAPCRADPSARLQIRDEAGQAAGFALWCGVGMASGVIELRRLGLATVGGGKGLGFVTALTDLGSCALGAQKIWLDCSGENLRAARVSEQAGYRPEGHQRAHWWWPGLGRVVDVRRYGMLRDDWPRQSRSCSPLPRSLHSD